MIQIGKMLLVGLILSLTVSCNTWKNTPWVGDAENQQLINKHGDTVSCGEDKFHDFICWSMDDVSELIQILDKCKVITNSEKYLAKKKLKKLRSERLRDN